ncbi:MAG: S-adenosylmethionine synthetase N-terminal domain-containing protein, partial [Gammaproteobacteria bacterium]|nr:S-adenosylmethionine synthetase N-terminal domain-containing protein [Gammaproteobacteria bacterium]
MTLTPQADVPLAASYLGATLGPGYRELQIHDGPARPAWGTIRRRIHNRIQSMSESYLFTSESVSEGHPDKIADQ